MQAGIKFPMKNVEHYNSECQMRSKKLMKLALTLGKPKQRDNCEGSFAEVKQ